MPCSWTKTAERTACAASPSALQSPQRTSSMGSPASNPSSTERSACGTGREVWVCGSANTYTSSPDTSNRSWRNTAPANTMDDVPTREQRTPTSSRSS